MGNDYLWKDLVYLPDLKRGDYVIDSQGRKYMVLSVYYMNRVPMVQVFAEGTTLNLLARDVKLC